MVEKTDRPQTEPAPTTGWLAACPPRRRHILIVWISIAVLYLAGVTGQWWPTPDSALYLSLGRSLAEGRGYVHNGSEHTLVTPGLPLILAGIRLAFGANYWAPNLFITLCGLATLGLVQLTLTHLSDRRIALAVTITTAVSYSFYMNSQRILTDIPFALLFWAILYSCIRAQQGRAVWLLSVAVLSFLGIVVRAPGILVIGPLAAGLLLQGRGQDSHAKTRLCGLVILGTMLTIAGLLLLVVWLISQSVPEYVTATLQNLSHGLRYSLLVFLGGLRKIPYTISELFTGQKGLFPVGWLVIALIAVGIGYLWRRGQRYIAALTVLCIFAHALLGQSTFRPRYLLSQLPVFGYVAIQGLCFCTDRIGRRIGRMPQPRMLLKVVTVYVAFLTACNSPKLLRNAFYYSYLSYTDRYYKVAWSGKHAELFPVADLLRAHCNENAAVGVPPDKMSVFHYLSECRMVPYYEGWQVSADEADQVIDFLTSRRKIICFVFDMYNRKDSLRKSYFDRLEVRLDDLRKRRIIERVDAGKRYHVYTRAPLAATQPCLNKSVGTPMQPKPQTRPKS